MGPSPQIIITLVFSQEDRDRSDSDNFLRLGCSKPNVLPAVVPVCLFLREKPVLGHPYPAGPQAHVPFLMEVAAHRAHTPASWKLPHVGAQSVSLF